MRFGLYIDSRPDVGPIASALQRAGFCNLWLYDSPLLFSDVGCAATLALEATSTLMVGPGVLNPRSRPVAYAAQLVATLAKIGPGRAAVGVGLGNSARRSLGVKPATVSELVSYVESLRALLAGRTTALDEPGSDALIELIHREGRWFDVTDPPPIWVSAFGPRSLDAAVSVGDGVIVRWEGPERAGTVRAALDAATAADGRPRRLAVLCALQPLTGDDDLDGPDLRAALGPLVLARLRYLAANARKPVDVPAALREPLAGYRAHLAALDVRRRHLENYRGLLVEVPDELARFVTADGIRAVAQVGPADEIAEVVAEMAEAGVSDVGLERTGDLVTYATQMSDVLEGAR